MKTPTPLAAATFYARWGLTVLGWKYIDGSKKPTHRWKLLQTVSRGEAEVRSWWLRHPDDNVGVVTGSASGVVVVDLDSEEAIEWADRHLPPTPWRVRTGRGEQRGYAYPGYHVGNRTHVAGMALDVRGDGGYVAMPPSVHKSGRVYQWLDRPWEHESLPAYSPQWLPQEPERQYTPQPRAADPDSAYRRAEAWMSKRDPAIQGSDGHRQTRGTAWALAGMGLSFDDAWSLLSAWNQTCSPPWKEGELREMLVGAWRKRA